MTSKSNIEFVLSEIERCVASGNFSVGPLQKTPKRPYSRKPKKNSLFLRSYSEDSDKKDDASC